MRFSVRRVLFYLGCVLLLAAFAAAAAEVVVHAERGREPGMATAHDLWYALAPGSLVIAHIRVERLSPALWDPVIVTILSWPAWVLLGLPGAALFAAFRPRRRMSDDERQDLREHEESLFLYDELARRAHEDGYVEEDDQAPDHGYHHLLDDGGVTSADEVEDFDIDLDQGPPPDK